MTQHIWGTADRGQESVESCTWFPETWWVLPIFTYGYALTEPSKASARPCNFERNLGLKTARIPSVITTWRCPAMALRKSMWFYQGWQAPPPCKTEASRWEETAVPFFVNSHLRTKSQGDTDTISYNNFYLLSCYFQEVMPQGFCSLPAIPTNQNQVSPWS